MSERRLGRFVIVSLVVLVVMSTISETVPRALDIPQAYGIVASAPGLAVILFSWHLWIQTSPGGLDATRYAEKPIGEQITDFAIVIGAATVITAIAAIIGIESGYIDRGELWGGGAVSMVATAIVLIAGMMGGVYAGLNRNKILQIKRDRGRGE